jgi:hypothetical protein
MEPLSQTTMPASVRCLLRKLRDVNLTTGRIALDGGARVSVLGCMSLDAPAETGVRYRLAVDGGGEPGAVARDLERFLRRAVQRRYGARHAFTARSTRLRQ